MPLATQRGKLLTHPVSWETLRNITIAQTLLTVRLHLHEMLEKTELYIDKKQVMGFYKGQEIGRREYKWDERNSSSLNLCYSHTNTNCCQNTSGCMPKPVNFIVYKLYFIKTLADNI